VLLASHNMAEVERLCSNVLMLKRGRLVDQGAPAELLRRYGRGNLEIPSSCLSFWIRC
jgi:ABC-2 type transport system ATP-binding protein